MDPGTTNDCPLFSEVVVVSLTHFLLGTSTTDCHLSPQQLLLPTHLELCRNISSCSKSHLEVKIGSIV